YGKNGATIHGGSSISGTLLTAGRYFDGENMNRAMITNLTFTPPTKAFVLGAWGNSLIFFKNAQYMNVSYCKFNFNYPYQHDGVMAVWVDGAASNYNFIYKNICNTVGIEYAESGA